MTKTFITDKDGATIDASTATVPSDRHFRNAWKLSGSVISEDMTEAKKIFKDKIREVRKPLLEAEDVVYMKACLLYTSPSPRDPTKSRMPSSA